MRTTATRAASLLAVAAMTLTACGSDDGARVREIGGDGGSMSGSASGSASASGPASGSASASGSAVSGSASPAASGDDAASAALGGYEPVSDVASHAEVTRDVCDVNAALDADPIDFEAARAVYVDGQHSRNGDGSARTLAGFATTERDEPLWNLYTAHFDDPAWLDTFVTAALDGDGPFDGESDAVRRQGVQKGIQNQVMVAWTFHELDAARTKAAAGELDPASGAPHNWDEAWAFYHGAEPGCAPYATADKRGANFGRGTAVNDAILTAFEDGRTALRDGDVEAVQAAVDEIVRQVTVTYVQAAIRYATKMEQALADGDVDAARVQQAEGWAFFRVIEPLVAEVDAQAAATVAEALDLANAPTSGAGERVRTALESTYGGLGISAAEVGEHES